MSTNEDLKAWKKKRKKKKEPQYGKDIAKMMTQKKIHFFELVKALFLKGLCNLLIWSLAFKHSHMRGTYMFLDWWKLYSLLKGLNYVKFVTLL
jgi:hypothetical protein